MRSGKGPTTISVINMKGGVGKSTVTTLLCRYAFFNLRLDVLAVDLDPQANLSQALMRREYTNFIKEKRASVVEIFNGYHPPGAGVPSPSPLDASSVVVDVYALGEKSLQLIPSRFDFSDNLIGSLKPDPRVLARFLASNFRHKDLIMIDCAPTESVLTHAAYHASGLVLVPVKPEYFATIGFPLLQESLTLFRRQNRSHHIDVSGIVINNGFYDGGNNGGPEKWEAMQEIKEEAKKNGWRIFDRQIPFSRGFPKIMRGNFSHSGNANSFYHFATEYFDKIGLKGASP